jgi:uncharacterized protein (TIGR01244 family)
MSRISFPMKRVFSLAAIPAVLGLTLALGACSSTGDTKEPAKPEHTPPTTEVLEPFACGTIQRLHTMGGVFLASQPSIQDFKDAKANGVATVINIRPAGEFTEFDIDKEVKALGFDYHNIGFKSAEDLSDDKLDLLRALLNGKAERPILMFCNSANRTGAVWLAHRVLDGGLSWDAAMAEAKMVGLKTPALENAVKAYIARRK